MYIVNVYNHFKWYINKMVGALVQQVSTLEFIDSLRPTSLSIARHSGKYAGYSQHIESGYQL
jgi:hypothetical protein